MKSNNVRREARLVSDTVSLNLTHLTSADVVTTDFVFGDVAAMI